MGRTREPLMIQIDVFIGLIFLALIVINAFTDSTGRWKDMQYNNLQANTINSSGISGLGQHYNPYHPYL